MIAKESTKIPGALSFTLLKILEELLQKTKPKITIEIGCLHGRTSNLLSQYSETLYCIDPWEPTKKYNWYDINTIDTHIKYTNHLKNITRLRPNEIDTINVDSVDFVFIDDSHLFPDTLKNILYWYKKLSPDGIMCGDDYHQNFIGVQKSVNAAANYLNKKILLYPYNSIIWQLV